MHKINSAMFLKMIQSANNNLMNEISLINNLNVFPVPDGDTGSNMSATFSLAFDKIQFLSSNKSVSSLFKIFAKESLLSARGNSGVILSQIFKGFSTGIKDKKTLDIKSIISGLEGAYKASYKSVISPVEGTILTIIKDAALTSQKIDYKDMSIEEFFEILIKNINISLNNTPNLLPILKKLNVIDSGAKGLVLIFEGMYSAIKGAIVKREVDTSNTAKSQFLMNQEIFNGEFGFCTEFILLLPIKKKLEKKSDIKNISFFKNKAFDREVFLELIKKMGSSSEVIVLDEEILKVHCHIPDPIKLLTHVKKFGQFFKVKIENMNEQTSSNVMNKNEEVNIDNTSDEEVKIGIISCNNGEGIIEDIKEFGAHFIIEGGQTMNPSAGDFILAINTLNTDKIIIFPNNSNVILAAKQAAQTTKNKEVIVLPTKTQIQGIVAMLQYNDEESLKYNIDEMKSAISEVKSIAITRAIRTTKINKVKIKENDYIGILDGEIILSNKSKNKIAIELIKNAIDDMSGIVTIYIGIDATIGDAREISAIIESECDIEVVIKNGLQPIYDFLISIE